MSRVDPGKTPSQSPHTPHPTPPTQAFAVRILASSKHLSWACPRRAPTNRTRRETYQHSSRCVPTSALPTLLPTGTTPVCQGIPNHIPARDRRHPYCHCTPLLPPPGPSSRPSGTVHDGLLDAETMVLAESYEYQRYAPIKGWSSPFLPGDPPAEADITRKLIQPRRDVFLPLVCSGNCKLPISLSSRHPSTSATPDTAVPFIGLGVEG